MSWRWALPLYQPAHRRNRSAARIDGMPRHQRYEPAEVRRAKVQDDAPLLRPSNGREHHSPANRKPHGSALWRLKGKSYMLARCLAAGGSEQ